MIRLYPVTPVSAPRQVRSHAWKPSPPVLRYRAYRDELTIKRLEIPFPFHQLIFVMPMPESWPLNKTNRLEGMPHLQKPDRDNLEKAVLDTAFGEDCQVWNGATLKVWGARGMLLVSDEFLPYSGSTPLRLEECYARAARWRVGDEPFHADELGLVSIPVAPLAR